MWVTHLNPISDGYDAGVLNTMPNVLHKFTYPFENGQKWNFGFEYRNLKYDNLTIDAQNKELSVNNPVPEKIMNQVKSDVAQGRKSEYTVPANFEAGGNPPDSEALGMAAWGTTYHYTVTIDNQDSKQRTAIFRIRNSSNVIFGLKKAGQSDYETEIYSMGDGENDWRAVSVDLPANTVTTFEVVTLPCGGNAGMKNQLVID